MLTPGDFVRCAVTGEPIALPDLRYWSVELQEAYASAEICLRALSFGATAGEEIARTAGRIDHSATPLIPALSLFRYSLPVSLERPVDQGREALGIGLGKAEPDLQRPAWRRQARASMPVAPLRRARSFSVLTSARLEPLREPEQTLGIGFAQTW